MIFGSYLNKGILAKDIDLLIVSNYFSDYFWQDRFGLLNLPGKHVYDLFLYTPNEFDVFLPIKSPLRKSIEKNNLNLEKYYGNGKI